MTSKSLESILDEVASPDRALAAGSAAALTVALAAALGVAAAKSLPAGDEAEGLIAQAENLRMRALELAERNRQQYSAALAALAARLNDPGHRDHRIGEALGETLTCLCRIAGAAADTAELAVTIGEESEAGTRPDVASAAALAEAGARAAMVLIEANLLTSPEDEAQSEALKDLNAATDARERAAALAAGA